MTTDVAPAASGAKGLFVIFGSPGTGKCLSERTMCATTGGLKTINQVRPGDVVPTVDGKHVVKTTIQSGEREVWRLSTRRGFEIEATPEHPFRIATARGATWSQLKDIRPGQYVALHVGTPHEDGDISADSVDVEFAWLLGALIADAWVNRSAGRQSPPTYTKHDVHMRARVRDAASVYLGSNAVDASRYGVVRLNGAHVRSRLEELGFSQALSKDKAVPAAVLSSSLSVQAAFIQGLFDGDGHVDKLGRIEWTTASAVLAKQVQLLLALQGIWASRNVKTILYQGEWRDYWRTTITGADCETFYQHVGFFQHEKAARLARGIVNAQSRSRNTNLDVVPHAGPLIREVFKSGQERAREEWRAWRRECEGSRMPSRGRVQALLRERADSEAAQRLSWMADDTVRWDAVVSIEPQGVVPVWDLEVPGAASFVANGFYVHNSTEVAATFQEALYVTSAQNVLQYYKNDFVKTEDAKARKLGLPKRELCIDLFSLDGKVDVQSGNLVRVSQKQSLEHYVINVALKTALIAKAEGKPPPWRNLVIDEAGTFWSRVFEEILPTCLAKSGAVDTLKAFGKIGEWSNYMTNHLRQFLFAGMNVVLISHAQEPDAASDKKGGPKFPSQSVMHQICADADGVLYRGFEDREIGKPSRRVTIAHGRQNWLSKLRGLPDHLFEEIKDRPLEDTVRLAGFEP